MCEPQHDQYDRYLLSLDDNKLKNIRDDLNKQINAEYININLLKNKILALEKILYDKCSHQWMIDMFSTNERTTYICKKCDLNK